MNRRRLRRIALGIVEVYLLVSIIGAILLAEMTLHPPRWPMERPHRISRYWQANYGSVLRDVSITAADGATLRGWYAVAAPDKHNSVILLHGVGDNREGVAGYAEFFLQHGYRVLLPDSRAHGESGGNMATYGLFEADDVHRWVKWMRQQAGTGCVYGFGESMGAAIVLQALREEHNFCGVIAESPFSTFRQVAYERTGLYFGLGPWFGRSLGRPLVELALIYTRLRYGLDLNRASPLNAVKQSSTPVLLIHGADDINILPWHSKRLARADTHAVLWIVPNAHHTGAWSTAPTEFENRVLTFMSDHVPVPRFPAPRASVGSANVVPRTPSMSAGLN